MEILDCTLRDGGYVNNWEFDTKVASDIIDALYASGIRNIELGILGTGATPGKQTKFNNFDEIKPLLKHRKKDCHYYVMFTQENAGNFKFPVCGADTPDSVRIAFFKKTWREAFETAADLKGKGYRVFLQAMATFMYSDDELIEMVKNVNEFSPASFYMVDSFSTMYPNDVIHMKEVVLSQLSDEVAFGFHAHNSIQMAFANVQAFMSGECRHDLFVDGSIYGMGRGAGNVPTELLVEYTKNKFGADYSALPMLKVYEKHIEKIYREYGWGYTPEYYLVAKYKTNSAYGWYFTSHGVKSLSDLDICLSRIPDDVRYTLKRDIADEIIGSLKNGK